jgi:hypothetical protein
MGMSGPLWVDVAWTNAGSYHDPWRRDARPARRRVVNAA